MRAAVAILLVGLLVSCTSAPFTVGLRGFDVDVATLQMNRAVFVKQSFDRPPFEVRHVVVTGNLTYQQGSISLVFYTSDREPCAPTSGVYICDVTDHEQVGSASFQSGATQPLRLSGSKLSSGINRGNLWIGVRLNSGLATAGTLQFRNMVARVTVLP